MNPSLKIQYKHICFIIIRTFLYPELFSLCSKSVQSTHEHICVHLLWMNQHNPNPKRPWTHRLCLANWINTVIIDDRETVQQRKGMKQRSLIQPTCASYNRETYNCRWTCHYQCSLTQHIITWTVTYAWLDFCFNTSQQINYHTSIRVTRDNNCIVECGEVHINLGYHMTCYICSFI